MTISMVYLVKVCTRIPHMHCLELTLAQLNMGKNSLLAMNSFRSWQFWGKLAGPIVGTIFLYTPVVNIGDYFALNYATFPPLCTAAMDLVAFLAVAALSKPLPETPEVERSTIGSFVTRFPSWHPAFAL